MNRSTQAVSGSRRAKRINLTETGHKKFDEVMKAFHGKHLRKDGEVVTDFHDAHDLAQKAAEVVSTNPITMNSSF